jgi:hypothetical protein
MNRQHGADRRAAILLFVIKRLRAATFYLGSVTARTVTPPYGHLNEPAA